MSALATFTASGGAGRGHRPSLAFLLPSQAERRPVMQMSDEDPKIDEEAVRRTAFFLWEQDGRPPDRELYYWEKALQQHIRQLAYDKWLAEGAPEGQAESHWQDAERQIRGK
jgi:hypothetical protein